MPPITHKAFAYITHAGRLLVFRHPFSPEAGIQVPAGTVEVNELPADAVMREAFEETGLSGLERVAFLGEHIRDMSDVGREQVDHRHFFHLRCTESPLEQWRHLETDPSDGSLEPIVFEFFWAQLPDGVPELICDHGKLLPRLLESLSAK